MDNDKELAKRRKEIKKIAMKKLRDRPPIFNKQAGFYITITGGGIDEFLNQPHKHYKEKNEMLLIIDEVLKAAEYKGTTTFNGRKSFIFETMLCEEETWIIVTEVKGRGISLYSISDSNRVLTGIVKPV